MIHKTSSVVEKWSCNKLQPHKKEKNVIQKYKAVLYAFAFGEWIYRYEYKRKRRRRQALPKSLRIKKAIALDNKTCPQNVSRLFF